MTSDPTAAEVRPTLSVVVPTYREAANVPVLFERLKTALDGLPWEMIVVDDNSPDGTADVAFAIARRDPRLRCLRRVNRLGLAGAVIEGWLSSSADFVAVIDGDLQHDETILPKMYAALVAGEGDLAIGTRVADETAPGGLSPARQKLSHLGAWFFRLLAGASVSDPMSGFFMIRREIVAAAGAAPVAGRVQDPRRRGAVGRRAAEDRRSPLCVPAAPGRRIEAVAAGRARLPRPRRPSRDAAGCCRSASCCSPRSAAIGLVVHLLVLTGLVEAIRPAGFRRRPNRRDDRRHGAAISCSTTRSPIAPTAIAASA